MGRPHPVVVETKGVRPLVSVISMYSFAHEALRSLFYSLQNYQYDEFWGGTISSVHNRDYICMKLNTSWSNQKHHRSQSPPSI